MIQVNQTTISEQAILSEMQYHPAESQRQAMMLAAEALIIAELVRQRAQALGLCRSEAASQDEDFLEALLARELQVPEASTAECERYFANNPQRFNNSPEVEVQHLLLAVPPEDEAARAAARAQAQELLAQLQRGQVFEVLVAQVSACPSKAQQGDLGCLSRGQTVPEFERQVFTGELGLIERPIETRYGIHLVKVNRFTPGTAYGFAQVKGQIQQYLNDKVRHRATAQYLQTLIETAQIEGYDFTLDARLGNT